MSTTQEAGAETTAVPTAVPTAAKPVRRPRKSRRLPRLDRCLNCDWTTGPDDNFCPNCGQKNEDETVALKPLVTDFLSEIASWDSKLTRTVWPLLFRPGFLTNEYLAGRRISYLPPLKMYLVISAVFFLVLPLTRRAPDAPPVAVTAPARVASTGAARVTVNDPTSDAGSAQFMPGNPILDRLPNTLAEYDAQQQDPHRAHHDDFLKALLFRQMIKARENKQTFEQSLVQGLLGNMPRMMFVLLPLFALQLKLTHPRRFYIEHLIFSLHTHAFLFTVLTLTRFASKAGVASGVIAAAFAVIMIVYLLAAMRRVYRQDWARTWVKFLCLGAGYVFLLAFALLLTGLVAFLTA